MQTQVLKIFPSYIKRDHRKITENNRQINEKIIQISRSFRHTVHFDLKNFY